MGSIAHARIGAELLIEALPAFCAGRLTASPQPVGTWRYARLTDDLMLSANMHVEDIALRAKVLGPLGKVYLDVGGRKYRIGGVSRGHQLAADAAVRVTPLSVEFNACDEGWRGQLRYLQTPQASFIDQCGFPPQTGARPRGGASLDLTIERCDFFRAQLSQK